MADTNTRVDILSLEDFRGRLDARLTTARTALSTLNGNLGGGTLPLGTFSDATSAARTYGTLHGQHVQRLERLILALETVKAATDKIIQNYRTAEERNRANGADIAAALSGVVVALNGGDPR